MQYDIGCSGWSYTSWQGPFYPQNLTNSGWLNYYSHVFDYVKIDSSFYRIPNVFMVNNWNTKIPKNFRYRAKFPRVITHEKRLKEVDKAFSVGGGGNNGVAGGSSSGQNSQGQNDNSK
ncbi:MAG TPA: DUF72 domain-containing protein [Bacteroidia bacterium]|nr:DUF72 domain-containing protein [Bacteroidia bacterium]